MSGFRRSVPKHLVVEWLALKIRNGYSLEPWEKKLHGAMMVADDLNRRIEVTMHANDRVGWGVNDAWQEA